MLLLKALKNKTVAKLWLGQAGSSIGDEVFRVAFTWLAVQSIGSDAGYLNSLQLFAVLIFGIFGGKWADQWNPYQTMVRVDLARSLITLIPVILFYLHRPSFTLLVIASILLSGLNAFFEPALQSILPFVAKDPSTRKAANGLMSTTIRLARVLGPCMIGFLSLFLPEIHFFTFNAFSFIFSAYCVFSIRKSIQLAPTKPHLHKTHVFSNFVQSIKLLHQKPSVSRILYLKTLSGGAWGLVFSLGFALLAREIRPNSVKDYGLVMGAYGLGNILAALIIASLNRKNSERLVCYGLIWLGIFFSLIAFTTHFSLLLVLIAISAAGGPLNDLPFTDFIQTEYHGTDLTKIVRLRMIFENFFTLIFMLIAPFLFHHFKTRFVILFSATLILTWGVYGLYRSFPKRIATKFI